MIRNTRNIAIQSPAGCWNYYQLIGAKVRVSSLSVASGLFSIDGDSIYTIKDIKFRMSRPGKAQASIYLNEISDRIFTWKDLEILSLGFGYNGYAIAGCAVCGEMICGLNVPGSPKEPTTDLVPGDSPLDSNILD